jgi:hypothetical protein
MSGKITQELHPVTLAKQMSGHYFIHSKMSEQAGAMHA